MDFSDFPRLDGKRFRRRLYSGAQLGAGASYSWLILGEFDAPLFAGNLPHGISLDASTLLVSFREASLGLRNYLAIWGNRLLVSLLAVGHPNNMERPGLAHRGAGLLQITLGVRRLGPLITQSPRRPK